MKAFQGVLTFKSADEILWCDHSMKSRSLAAFSETIHFSVFYKMKIRICLEF